MEATSPTFQNGAAIHHGYHSLPETVANKTMNDQNSLIGLQIDNFEIRKLLGSGGMASVYLASDVSLKRDVAIKVLLPALAENKELRLRFQREAQATASCSTPTLSRSSQQG